MHVESYLKTQKELLMENIVKTKSQINKLTENKSKTLKFY